MISYDVQDEDLLQAQDEALLLLRLLLLVLLLLLLLVRRHGRGTDKGRFREEPTLRTP